MIKLTRAAVCGPNSLALLLVLFCCLAVEGYEDRWDSHGRSAPADAAAARRLVASTSWGVVSTTSLHLNGTAYG